MRDQARPGDQERPDLLAGLAFDRDLAIPADPDQFGEAARVVLVALVHPHRERGMGMAGIDADHRKADPPEFVPEPARHGAGLEADALGIRCALPNSSVSAPGSDLASPSIDGAARLVDNTDEVSFCDTSSPTYCFIVALRFVQLREDLKSS